LVLAIGALLSASAITAAEVEPNAAPGSDSTHRTSPALNPTTRPAATRPATFQGLAARAPATPGTKNDDLTNLSLEDLMNVEVTSVQKRPEKASEAPAAVTVIGQDDIARSGLQTIPNLLRLVPDMDVAQLNANTWAIGARGFNDIYSNKLLVLNDGRSVYTPEFSGVFWDMQEPLLADLDRIEVIRGPEATLYGSNAVDGVVNITTKSAKDTQGWYLTGTGGNQVQSGGVRFGGQLDETTYFRVYETYRRTDDFRTPDGNDARDGWQGDSAGFRLDRYATASDVLTLQGDVESNREGQTVLIPSYRSPYRAYENSSFNAVGADVLGRWTHKVSDTEDYSLQMYYDHVDHPIQLSPYKTDTGDVTFRDHFMIGRHQEVTWGAEYRFWASELGTGPIAGSFPAHRDDYLASAFAQDDWSVVPDRVHLIGGTELEETSLGGFNVQPTGQLLWTPNDNNTAWSSISRAVRDPSQWEKGAFVNGSVVPIPGQPLPAQSVVRGDASYGDENEVSYQLGYRLKPAKTLSFDLNGSYNHYNGLRSFDQGTPSVVYTPSPHLLVPLSAANSIDADTYSVSVAANWQVTPNWRLASSYSLLIPHAYDNNANHAADVPVVDLINGGAPRNQAQIHSYWDVTPKIQVNTSVYFVDRLGTQDLPAYVRTDVNVVWRPRERLSLTLGFQNIFDSHHPEYNEVDSSYTVETESPFSVYGQVSYQF
jgi:iron complex outermembrane receptor protein